MIPIVAMSNLVTAVVAAAITGLIAKSYRRHQDDQLLKDFLMFFAFLNLDY